MGDMDLLLELLVVDGKLLIMAVQFEANAAVFH